MKTPQHFLKVIKHEGILPLFNHPDVSVCMMVLQAIYDAGIRVFEFTNRHPDAYDVFLELKNYSLKYCPGMMLGVGTIKNVLHAAAFAEAGADFLISPCISKELCVFSAENDHCWIPGCATPSEVALAENHGFGTIKVFPATFLGGPGYISAIRSVFPELNLLATGGIKMQPDILKEWYRTGVIAIGAGTDLIRPDLLEQRDKGKLTDHIRQIAHYVTLARSQHQFNH